MTSDTPEQLAAVKEQITKAVLQEFGVTALNDLPPTLRKIAEHRIDRKFYKYKMRDRKFTMKEEIIHELPADLQKEVPKTMPLYGIDAILAEAAIDPEGFYHVDENTKIDLNSPDMTVIKKLRTGEVVKMPLSEYLKVPEPLLPRKGESIPEFLARAKAAEEEEKRYALLHDLEYVSPFEKDKNEHHMFFYNLEEEKQKRKDKLNKEKKKNKSKAKKRNSKHNKKPRSIYDYMEDPLVKKVLEEKVDKTLSKHDKINNMDMIKSENKTMPVAKSPEKNVKITETVSANEVVDTQNEGGNIKGENSVNAVENRPPVDPNTVVQDLGEYTMQYGLEHKDFTSTVANSSVPVNTNNASNVVNGAANSVVDNNMNVANTVTAQPNQTNQGVINNNVNDGNMSVQTAVANNINASQTDFSTNNRIVNSGSINNNMSNAQATGQVLVNAANAKNSASTMNPSTSNLSTLQPNNASVSNVVQNTTVQSQVNQTNTQTNIPDVDELRQRIQRKHIPGVDLDEPQWEDNDRIPRAEPDVILDPSLARYKILIIEDNSDVRYQYEFMLKREGFTVITARNGEEGIITAIKERPQLILLDILMPEVDGWEVLKALREYTSTYKPKIMITSNLGAPEDIEKAYKLGADLFVIKADTTLQELINKVKQMLFQSEQKKVYLLPFNFNTPEVKDLLGNTYPELRNGRCPSCGGPIGLKLIPIHKQDPVLKRIILEFSARYVCLRCGKEWV